VNPKSLEFLWNVVHECCFWTICGRLVTSMYGSFVYVKGGFVHGL
jgi:hypothetical protein